MFLKYCEAQAKGRKGMVRKKVHKGHWKALKLLTRAYIKVGLGHLLRWLKCKRTIIDKPVGKQNTCMYKKSMSRYLDILLGEVMVSDLR